MKSRKWLKKASRLTVQCLRWVILLVICTLLYARVIEPNWIEINSLELTLPHLSSEFNGYRIVQISDIHRDRWMNSRYLERVISLVNQQKPDLVAITGDIVTRNSPTFIPTLKAPLSQLKSQDKTVAVLGNHDYENDSDAIIQTIEQSGILHLGNYVYTLKRGSAMLHIAGVDDITAGKDRLDLVLQQLPEEGAAILLAHEPDFADISAMTKRFDLQLSGHSHGGQIRLPFFPPLALPSLSEKYYSGSYQVGEMIQYTNRGIGMAGVHLRFGARPEITVFTLAAPKHD
ncbi:metallophosphoesterase [Calothrix sp. NIES-2098]|uniref:metallophosphoesterase n=1 Tax=Calothrix sp. NIES-2098 TaxID=1954171 RepID=UPI000B5F00D7|nr:putative Ser/Thr protein phosphatase family protein [Calothrix sp. NIES-2098]